MTNKDKVLKAIIDLTIKGNAYRKERGKPPLMPEQAPYTVYVTLVMALHPATGLKGSQIKKALEDLTAEGLVAASC